MSSDAPNRGHGPLAAPSDGVPTELEAVDDQEPVARDREGRVYLVARLAGATWVIDLEQDAVVTVGRAPESTVVVDETRVSRHHARLWRTGALLAVEDLGSRNGT